MTDGPPLLERNQHLTLLSEAMALATAGQGRMFLLGGEAGVGKTTLVRRFGESLSGAKVLIGACDPLPTPLALGPLMDLAPGLGPAFEHLLDGSRSGGDLFAPILSHLAALRDPTLLVFEDMHWADQASLELLTFLGRRAERLPALIVATFREEDLELNRPLAVMLGDLATAPAVRRLGLTPLSRRATEQLAKGAAKDVDELYRRTGGNPFFITEVLSDQDSGQDVPPTVRDAVLARVTRRPAEVRWALEAAAAIGVRVGPGLLTRVVEAAGTPRWAVDEAVSAGLLERQDGWLVFRHELAAAAIANATPPEQRQLLHGLILGELRQQGAADPATLVRHAEAAGDDTTVLELAPLAAARAAALGAHREAAQLYGKALERARDQPAAVRAELLEHRATERYLSRQVASAIEDHRAAAELLSDAGDRPGEARNLIRLAYLSFVDGDLQGSEIALSTATSILEELPPSPELVTAYEAWGRRLFMCHQLGEAEAWAKRAAALAERLGYADLALAARLTAGAAIVLAGDESGHTELKRLREVASKRALEDARVRDTYARALYYLGLLPMMQHRYEDVDEYLEEGWRHALEHDLGYWQGMIAGARVLRALSQGHWQQVEPRARVVLDMEAPVSLPRLQALVAVGRVKARSGQPDALRYLDEAAVVARRERAAEGMAPVWPARAEAAWLMGDRDRVLQEASAGRAESMGVNNPWWEGELAFWVHMAGGAVDPAASRPEPYRLAISGDWAEAATWWERRGCPYEMAIAFAAGSEPGGVRRAVSVLDRLGAGAAAAYARRRLRQLGVTSVPRGPRPSTAANPAGLSRREQEVLELVATGLTNAEMAARLFLSEKTVERHLAGIFAKLDVSSRREAVESGLRLGAIEGDQIGGRRPPS